MPYLIVMTPFVPVADLMQSLAVELSAPSAPRAIATEPSFMTLADFAAAFPVHPGEVTAIQGSVPTVRMLIASLAVGPWRDKRVGLADDCYAGPGVHDFLAAVSGVPLLGSRADADFVWGAAAFLSDRALSMVSGPTPWSALPAAQDVVVVEPDGYAGGLPAIVDDAAASDVAVVVPVCEADPVEISCRTFALRHAGHFSSGRCHVTVQAGEDKTRLAYSGRSGRFE